MTDLSDLIERVRAAKGADNALDVAIEVATFQPDARYAAVRENAAGTKLIYTTQDGEKQTCLAWDWTLTADKREKAVKLLLSLQEPKP